MFASIKQNLKENILSYVFVGVGVVLSLFSSFLYIGTGVTIFVLKLQPLVVALPLVAAAVGLLSVCFGYKTVKYVAFLIALFAFLAFVRDEMNYISNVFVGIDNNSFTPTFLLTFIGLTLAIVAFLVSGITQKERFLAEAAKE